MPDNNNPRSWRGVSTTQEDSSLHFLSEELNRLRTSMENLQRNSANTIGTSPIESLGSAMIVENQHSSVLQVVKQSEELRKRISDTLRSNQEFKLKMASYFEQSTTIDNVSQELSLTDIDQLNLAPDSGTLADSSGTMKNRIVSWINSVGVEAGRTLAFRLRARWTSLRSLTDRSRTV